MRWIKDNTRRFGERPMYEIEELDDLCETRVREFLLQRYGSVVFPIETNDLTILLEGLVEDLDLYAEFRGDEADAEGLTTFLPGGRPSVRIARELSEEPWRENRLRTTLTHELGHVVIHGPLYDRGTQPLLPMMDLAAPSSPRCKRASEPIGEFVDWLEWQARYVSGAFLMPAQILSKLVGDLVAETGALCPVTVGSEVGTEMVASTVKAFAVSEAAARVRLAQKGYLTDATVPRSLFG